MANEGFLSKASMKLREGQRPAMDRKLIICRFSLVIAALAAASGDAPVSDEIEAVSEFVRYMLPAHCDCEELLNKKKRKLSYRAYA